MAGASKLQRDDAEEQRDTPGRFERHTMRFLRVEWRVQRVGWIGFVLVIAAALLGLFGNGPLSRASAETSGVTLEYQRFGRWRSPTTLSLTVAGSDRGASETIVWFDRAYIDSMAMARIVPEPRETRAGDDRIGFVFDAAPHAHMKIAFHLEPETRGRIECRLSVQRGWDGPTDDLVFWQFMYP